MATIRMLPTQPATEWEGPAYAEIRERVDSLIETEDLLSIAFDHLDTPPRAVLEVLDAISPVALTELRDVLRAKVGLGWT